MFVLSYSLCLPAQFGRPTEFKPSTNFLESLTTRIPRDAYRCALTDLLTTDLGLGDGDAPRPSFCLWRGDEPSTVTSLLTGPYLM